MSFFPENNKYMGKTDYLKLKDGQEARIRIMSTPIVGWEYWPSPKTVVRYFPEKKPRSTVSADQLKEFTAMVVYNYDLDLLQIWSFSQSRVKESLEVLCKNKGSPFDYDIVVSRHGEDTDTRYILRALSPCKVDKNIEIIFETTPINLYALYVSKDPFKDLDAGKEVSHDISVA